MLIAKHTVFGRTTLAGKVLPGLALIATTALWLAGCGGGGGSTATSTSTASDGGSTAQSTASKTSPVDQAALAQAAFLNGVARGGGQPLVGATVTAYAAGLNPGNASTQLGQTVTDSAGNFSIPGFNSVPASGQLVYVMVQGGNAGAGSNANSRLLGVAGAFCAGSGCTFSNTVGVTELSTVAAASVFQRNIDIVNCSTITGDTNGSTNTCAAIVGATGLAARAMTLNSLINVANGQISSFLSAAVSGTPLMLTEQKLNTLASVLATCVQSTGGVNGDGSACGNLFSQAVPATDTLAAALQLAGNPTANANGSGVFKLLPLLPVYVPVVASVPANWTVGGSQYSVMANSSGNSVSAFGIDVDSGDLSPAAGAATGSKPVGAVVDPSGRFAYVANSGSNSVSAYTIDPATGALAAIGGSPFEAGQQPSAAAVDPSDRFVYVTNAGDNTVSAYRIGSGGALTALGSVSTGAAPAGVAATGSYVLVANGGSNNVSVYSIGSSGALSAVSGSPFAAGTMPAAIAVDPTGQYAYVANRGGNNVSGFVINASSGALSATGSAIGTGSQPTGITVDAGGRFVYVSNIGDNTVSAYAMGNGGALAATGATLAAGKAPGPVLSDLSGQYIYAFNTGDGSVSTYSANAGSGALVPSTGSDLVISEVGSNYYSNSSAWFEIFNTGSAPVSLSGYQLRCWSVATAGGSLAINTFSLPSVTVPAHGFMVVAGNTSASFSNGNQIVYVGSSSSVPYWSGNGFVELDHNGATLDFVRFGNDTTAPLSASQWSGADTAALPAGAAKYGMSLVRPMHGLTPALRSRTHTTADWTLVNFSTPGGSNDIAAGITDSDSDGIPDSAKLAGGTYSGLDLFDMGARPGQRDIFIEVGHMNQNPETSETDPGLIPRSEALAKVVTAFLPHGIHLHFDTGTLYSTASNGMDPANYNLGGGLAVPFSACSTLGATSSSCTSIYTDRFAYSDLRRRVMFHYALFANSQNADGSAGSSGISETPGADILITLGGWGLSTEAGSDLNVLINYQAGTLMHEFGHNLGLLHGGNVADNYKPNYVSVMNYLYQLSGIGSSLTDATAADRWYDHAGSKAHPTSDCGGSTTVSLTNSPCSSNFKIDYSDGSGAALNEAALLESANIGRGSTGSAYVDWNGNGAQDAAAYSQTIDSDSSVKSTTLNDYNDWANLNLPFARGGSSVGFGVSKRSVKTSDLVQVQPQYDAMTPQNAAVTVETSVWRQLHR